MRYYYFNNSFFVDGIHEIPAGAVAISAEYYRELLEQKSLGLVIQPDANGYPVAAPPPPPSAKEQAAARRTEILAELYEIDHLSVRPLRAIIRGVGTDADNNKLATLEAQAEELRAKLAELKWPEMEPDG